MAKHAHALRRWLAGCHGHGRHHAKCYSGVYARTPDKVLVPVFLRVGIALCLSQLFQVQLVLELFLPAGSAAGSAAGVCVVVVVRSGCGAVWKMRCIGAVCLQEGKRDVCCSPTFLGASMRFG